MFIQLRFLHIFTFDITSTKIPFMKEGYVNVHVNIYKYTFSYIHGSN